MHKHQEEWNDAGHDSSHGGDHHHHHEHTQTKSVLNRLSRAAGHLESVKKMVESGRDCTEVLIQLSAVKSAINNVGKKFYRIILSIVSLMRWKITTKRLWKNSEKQLTAL